MGRKEEKDELSFEGGYFAINNLIHLKSSSFLPGRTKAQTQTCRRHTARRRRGYGKIIYKNKEHGSL